MEGIMDVFTCPNHHVRIINSDSVSYQILEECIYCKEKMIYAGSLEYDDKEKVYYGTCYKKIISPLKVAQREYYKEQNLYVHAVFPEQAIVFSTPDLVYFETGQPYKREEERS
jgi:hypothetical protein